MPPVNIQKHLTPVTHGYVVCARCGVWRPEAACTQYEKTVSSVASVITFKACTDEGWCRAQTSERVSSSSSAEIFDKPVVVNGPKAPRTSPADGPSSEG